MKALAGAVRRLIPGATPLLTTEFLDNRYKVLQALGEGAMGQVYLVEDGTSGQALAMKVLSRQLEGSDKSFLQLKQEFRVMAQLRHPNCCAVYDYGQLPDGAPFLTMEVVPGKGLDEVLPLRTEQVKPVLAQLLLALGYVHQLGYVHCDIKAANVRLKPDGGVKLMDYGLMEVAGRSGAPIRGTLAYLAPEVVKRGPVDRRADLYSVGALAFELLTGRAPFVSAQPMEVLRAHVTTAPPRPSSLMTIEPGLEAIVMKLLEKEPLDRYQSAYEVLEDLGVEVPAGIGGNLLTSPMMGRDPDLETLAAHLPDLTAGKPGAAYLLIGEAGIGKSRLLEELRFRTQLDDLAYVAGAAPERAAVPYGPWVEALRKLLPLARAQAPETLAKLAPVLVKLLPEIGVPPAPDLDPPGREKLRLQDAICTLFDDVAARRGLVLALEDWHRADALSNELLDFVLRNSPEAPLLVLVSTRHLPETPPNWLAAMRRLDLGPLEARPLWRMVTSMLGTEEVGAGFMRQISDFAGGNPFMVERLLEHLVREGVLASTKGKWHTQLELTAEHMPGDLGALLLRKLEALSEGARELARAAAVVGDAFRLDALKIITGWGEDALFDALQALEMAQVLVATGEGGAYRFAQGQLQVQLYESLPVEQRAVYHASVAIAIEERYHGIRPAEIPIEDVTALAYHSLRAGVADKAILYALEAGNRSFQLFALVDAEHFLAEGLALLRLEPDTRWRRQLLSYLQVLGDVRRVAGRAKDAKEVLSEAIDLAEELGLTRELGRLLGSQAKACLVLAEYPVALEYAQRSVRISESAGDDFNVSRALLVSGRVLFFLGKLPEALEAAARAVEVAQASGDVTIMGSAYAWAGYCYVASSDPAKIPLGVDQLGRSLALLQEASDKLGQINSYNLLGNAQNMLGNHLDAWRSFTQCRTLAFEAGSRADEIVAAINLSCTALELGNFTEAVHRAEEAEELSVKNNVKYALGYAQALGALAGVALGQVAGVAARFQVAVDFTRELKNKYVEALILQYQVEALLEVGRLDAAAAAGKELRELIEATGNTEPETRLNALMAEVHVRRGELEDAGWRADLALQASTAALAQGMQVRAIRVKALVALARNQWDDARGLALEALAIGEAIGTKYQNAQLLGLLGELDLATATSEPEAHFRAMEVLATQTDAKPLLAQALLGRAAARPAAPEAAALAAEAHAVQAALLVPLEDDAAREAWLGFPERKRVSAGDWVGYSLPRRLADRAAAFVLWLRGFRGRLG